MMSMRHERAFEMIEPIRMREPMSTYSLTNLFGHFNGPLGGEVTPKERKRRQRKLRISKLSRRRNRGK